MEREDGAKNDLQFIHARPEMAEELTVICRTSKAIWGYPGEWLKSWEEELTITPAYIRENDVWVLIRSGEVLGFCGIEQHPGYYEVGHLWLRPGQSGKGFGGLLLTHALDNSVPTGAEVRALADPNAEKFYRRHGFVTFDSIASTPGGRYLPLMRKNQ